MSAALQSVGVFARTPTRVSRVRTVAARAGMSSPSAPPAETTVVSAAWLKENIDRVKLLDCSWYLPAMNRDARAEHAASRLPGARYFDVDRVSDPSSPLPHMLPSEAQFAAACDALGIRNDDQIVVYDGAGLFSAARGWWMFRVFGHRAVALLDGGAPAWLAAGGNIEDTPVDIQAVDAASAASAAAASSSSSSPSSSSSYRASLNPSLVRSKADVLSRCVESNAERLVDARPAPRWRGKAPEPRAGIRSGRAPGSKCVPFFDVLDDDKRFKSPREIAAAFEAAGVDLADRSTPVVASCGTGVTACVLSLGAAVADPSRPDGLPVYDGSWTEWGAEDSGCPVEVDEEK